MQSYSSIQNIFFKNKKYGATDILALQQFCLTNAAILSCEQFDIPEKVDCITTSNDDHRVQHFDCIREPQYLIPKHSDTLFWCVFISVYGLGEYYQIGHSYGNRILEEKMKIANWIKSAKKSLKNSNFKFTNELIEETMSEFMVDKSTSFNGLAALALYYKRNIYVLDDKRKLYMKFLSPDSDSDSDSESIYIYYHDFMRGEYKYKICTDIDEKQQPPDFLHSGSMFCLENVNKPLKPVSTYKVDDLINIASIIGVNINEKVKKQDLYNMILEKCQWTAVAVTKR
jgi:hypothetical protein